MDNIFKRKGSTKDMSKEMKKLRDWLIKKRGKNIKNKSSGVGQGLSFYQDSKDNDYFDFTMKVSNVTITITHTDYLAERNEEIYFDYKSFINEFKNRINKE